MGDTGLVGMVGLAGGGGDVTTGEDASGLDGGFAPPTGPVLLFVGIDKGEGTCNLGVEVDFVKVGVGLVSFPKLD